MTGSFPRITQSRFPNDLPPTIFSPASPKVKAIKSENKELEADTESIASQATFSSTVSLIKRAAKKTSLSEVFKERRTNRKEDTTTTVVEKKPSGRKARKPLPEDPISPRQRTAEGYMYLAHR